MVMKQLTRAVLLAAIALARCAAAQATDAACASTYYQFADGSGVDVAPSDEGHLRWRRIDGTTGYLSPAANGTWSSALGWTGRDDGTVVDLARCGEGEIRFAGVVGHRLPLDSSEARFASGDVQLAGRLVLPAGHDAVPIVVLVHGSEDSSALRFFALQRMLPAQGVGVFVYDKRGTGASSGVFTHDLQQLAADAHAALDTARTMAGARAGRVGYYGTSQGGWTAPLAAKLGHADFVIVGYGLAVSPLDEDREALTLDMTRHGFGATEVAKSLEIGTAAQAVVRNGFKSGYDELRAVVDKYKPGPWFRFVRGNVTGVVLAMPEAELREKGARLFAGLDLDYDPMPVLRSLKTPQLWILGGEDIGAPYLETYRRLLALRSTKLPIAIVVYPQVEHGLYAFETQADERLSTRQPASLQRLIVAFARGQRLDAQYDDARVLPATAESPAACLAQPFAPGVISGPDHDAAPAFAPDGRTVWFGRSDATHSTILEAHLEGGRWSMPRAASFSGRWRDMEPAMSPDGRYLVFVSNRPADGVGAPLDGFFMGNAFPGGGGNLWRVEHTADGWSAPVRLPDVVNSDTSTFAPSVVADGSLWFMRPTDGGRRFRLYRAQWRDEHFEAPRPLPFSDGTSTDVDPAVAPDESFVVFGSNRPPARDMDLFIALRHGSAWDEPRHLGDVVNSPGSDAEARLSPDARTLYFSSERRSTAPADRDAAWNNGKYNIWSVDLASCAGANATPSPSTGLTP